MAKCKSCNANIIWFKTKAGKSMPCNPGQVKYWQKHNGSKRIVTPEGDVIACELEPPCTAGELPETGTGYVSHFATCPDAGSHRRKA